MDSRTRRPRTGRICETLLMSLAPGFTSEGRRRTLSAAVRLGVCSAVHAVAPAVMVRSVRAADGRASALGPFSHVAPGPLPPDTGWVHQPLRGIPPNHAEVVAHGRSAVLRITSEGSASGWSHPVPGGLRRAGRLHWTWAVQGAPALSVPGEKSGDDFAARVYVIFDYPLERVPFSARLGIRLARALYGQDVPAAALCYVWHPGVQTEVFFPSPYTSRVQMLVPRALESAGPWKTVTRDLRADFERTFGPEFGTGMPPLKAIVLSADTDQGGGRVDAFFGDVTLSGVPG